MTQTTYRISHLQLLPLLSGVQRVTLDELERLDDGAERWLLCQELGPLTEGAQASGARVVTVPPLVREIHPLQDLKALWQLWRCFRRERFDVVHTHSSKTGVLGRLAARLAGVPCIVHTVHGFAFPAAKSRLQRRVFHAMEWLGGRCSHQVICLHEEDAHICREQLGLPADKVVVLANGIDVGKFRPLIEGEDRPALRRSLGLPEGRQLILMVGRLWEQKNPSCLVDAYRRLWASGDPGADLVLVGDGELQPELAKVVQEAGLAEHVHFLGWRTDTPELLRSSDIFVLPSRWEGMPLAILEAMGSGLPVVVSDIPGNRHLVEDGAQGLLFPTEDDQALAASLRRLIDEQELRQQLGRAGRQKVAAEHDVQHRVAQMSALYRQVLGHDIESVSQTTS